MTGARRTRTYHALAHDFQLEFEDAALQDYFEYLLDAFEPAQNGAVTEYAVAQVDRDGPSYEFTIDGEPVLAAPTASAAASALVHRINNQAIEIEYAVTCHAGGVERAGVGVILPADPESGKTTLTAGLVRAGFRYLTDEGVAFGWETQLIEPFPKPLSLDPGTWPLFPELTPEPAPGEDAPPTDQWQIPPSAFRADAVGAPCRADLVVFPRYQEDADTTLSAMTRADALVEMAKNTFRFNRHPRRALDMLTEVVRGAECYRIVVGDLTDACRVITELVDG
jgi:hypothetical protein